MGVIRLHCRPARISRQLGQIRGTGATKIPYSWCWWWCWCWDRSPLFMVSQKFPIHGAAAGLLDWSSLLVVVVLLRQIRSHSHISFSALVALVVVEKYMDGCFLRRGREFDFKGMLENLTSWAFGLVTLEGLLSSFPLGFFVFISLQGCGILPSVMSHHNTSKTAAWSQVDLQPTFATFRFWWQLCSSWAT